MTARTTHRLFVQCALGVEALVQADLEEFGIVSRAAEGGVECRGDFKELVRICLSSRLAESVRVRLKEFEARQWSELEKKLRALPFRAFLPPKERVRVKVVCHKSKLWHSDAVKARVEGVLATHVGWKITDAEGAQLVHVRLDEDKVQVSIDASGERMHRRGYRTHVEKASLRETLAAALCLSLDRAAYATEAPVLWDPFCGAGTIPLEMLSLCHGRLPGVGRVHAFERWRDHDAPLLVAYKEEFLAEAREKARAPALRAICSDVSRSAVESAQENAQGAGLEGSCEFLAGDVVEIATKVPPGAFVLTNPPYGKRIEQAGAVKKLLSLLEKRADLRPVVILVGGAARDLVPQDRPALFRTKNGGIPVSARLLRA
jgi:putative N6-adenine-specific DNA methylase